MPARRATAVFLRAIESFHINRVIQQFAWRMWMGVMCTRKVSSISAAPNEEHL
jgi:hypothetical protein